MGKSRIETDKITPEQFITEVVKEYFSDAEEKKNLDTRQREKSSEHLISSQFCAESFSTSN